MLFGQDRGELRRMYIESWRKARAGEVLSPLEAQIADVVALHPEYHACLDPVAAEADYPADGRGNPFLHMGLHLAVRDQVATDRPAGIKNIFNNLLAKYDDLHEVEHRVSACLAEALREAARLSRPPDEARYLDRLKAL